jgi:hypothetical protein
VVVADTDVLWGGTLLSLALDPVAWRLSGEVEVVSEGTVRRYAVVLDEVRGMHVDRSVPLPWNYAEVTEVHTSRSADGSVVDLVLWEDGTGIRAAGSRLTVAPIS